MPPQQTENESDSNVRLRVYLGHTIEPAAIKAAVAELGGYEAVVQERQWQLVRRKLNLPEGTSSGYVDVVAHGLRFCLCFCRCMCQTICSHD